MRVSIIVEDDIVLVNGYGLKGLDLSSLPEGTWALQWRGNSGHIEKDDGANIEIDSLAPYQSILDEHAAKKAEIEAPVEYTPKERRGRNKNAAIQKQDEALNAVIRDEQRTANGLVSLLTPTEKQDLIDYAKGLNGDVTNPSEDKAYTPQLPPNAGRSL